MACRRALVRPRLYQASLPEGSCCGVVKDRQLLKESQGLTSGSIHRQGCRGRGEDGVVMVGRIRSGHKDGGREAYSNNAIQAAR
jgi:hypothetical protein